MKNFNPVREFVFDYIMVVAEITLATAVIGSIFAGDTLIHYSQFFMPFLLGMICMLPCIPIYVKEDMTVKQVLLQRIVELIVLEAALLYAVWNMVGNVLSREGYIAIIFSTAFFDILSYLLKWFLEKEEVDKINKWLREHRTGRSV